MDRQQIAEEVLAAVGGKANVTANDICMTRLRIVTEDPTLVDTDQLASARGVLGFVRRGANGIEVVFGPGKVEAVHEALVKLTGIEGNEEVFDELASTRPSPILVHITPNPLKSAAVAQRDADAAPAASDDAPAAGPVISADDEMGELVSLLSALGAVDDDADEPDDEVGADALADTLGDSLADSLADPLSDPLADAEAADGLGAEGAASRGRLLVINGPNINMLGIREPGIYGHDSYQALLRTCREAAREAGFSECSCFQSNHEGDLVEAIQDAYDAYDGIVINPGAYTHTSIAILDAAKAVGLPMVEVHISKVDEREEFRRVSYIRAACFETVAGQGIEGYRTAIHDLAAHLGL